jgi:hypothetical protein
MEKCLCLIARCFALPVRGMGGFRLLNVFTPFGSHSASLIKTFAAFFTP